MTKLYNGKGNSKTSNVIMPDKLQRYSIILPVRNGGEYVKECVKSILSQTLNDFNLIVLDNSSTDRTPGWISSLNDNRIVIYPSEKPLTIEENWARITTIPKNEFITLIGHDDILDSNYLEVMDGLIKKHPEASLYQAHFRYIDANGNIIRKCKPMDGKQTIAEFATSIFTFTLDTMGTGYMMRSSDYDRAGGISLYPNLLFADHTLWFRLTAISYKATAPEECFSFRTHQSVSRVTNAVKYISAFYTFLDFLIPFRLTDEQIHAVINKYFSGYALYYCRSLSHRLLRTPASEREGITVSSFIGSCKAYVNILAPGNSFQPRKQFNIFIAEQIDNYPLFRKLFFLFKRIYKKPIYS